MKEKAPPIGMSTDNIDARTARAIQLKKAGPLPDPETYRMVFRKSPAFFIILDTSGNVVEWNEETERAYGASIAGRTLHFKEFICEGEVKAIREVFADLFESGRTLVSRFDREQMASNAEYRESCAARLSAIGHREGTTRFSSKDGAGSVDAEYRVTLLFNPVSLDIDGFIVSAYDITLKTHTRQRLEESERKYRELFRIMPVFAMLVDTAGRAVEINDAMRAGCGVTGTEGESSFLDFIHENDQYRAAGRLVELYSGALKVKNRWALEKSIDAEECASELRTLGIRNEAMRFVDASGGRVIDVEFSANLWIGDRDLSIRGALITAADVSERNRYRERLEYSERKYREIVEDKTRDVIFSLDTEGRFVTVNKNMREKLGYSESEVRGRFIADILYQDPMDKSNLNRETMLESLERVLREHDPDVRFKAVCSHKFLGETVSLHFKLDPIFADRTFTGVMGFASEKADDPLLKYVESESITYRIDNRLTIADEISYRLTRNLPRFVNESRVNMIRLGLREIIVNSIEHGNLNITYEEKSVAQEERSYQILLRQRQLNPLISKKKVVIGYHLDLAGVVYTVTDEGGGFDHSKYLGDHLETINEQMLQHGRGIIIAHSVFDEMIYNDKGNQITMVAYFKPS